MNTTIKKIVGGFIAVVAFALPAVSFAATFDQGISTLLVANKTTGTAGCTTCWTGAASASASQSVSFALYYHNIGVDTATNVRIRLNPQSTAVGTLQTFTATVSADNAPAVTGTATVTISSPQTLSFVPGSVLWYANQLSTPTPLLAGQTGAELFNGVGLNVGNIATGWPTQGSITVTFQVSSAAATTLPTVTTSSASALSQTGASLNGFVTPNGVNTNAWFEWGTTPTYGNTTTSMSYGTVATNYNSALSGLTANTTYYFRAVAQNAQGIAYGTQMSFVTSVAAATTLPTVTTSSASALSQTGASLNGFVTPNGVNTNAWFEWGTTPTYGNTTTSMSYGTVATNYNSALSGLTANTTYYFRAVAQNAQGIAYGTQMSFVTSGNNGGNGNYNVVMVSTRNADTSSDFAVLNGYVDPAGTNDTVRWFEWGGSQALGNSTQKIAQGTVASNFSDSLSGLVSNTTYYYRAAARNSQGTVYGNTLSFATGAQTTGIVGSSPTATTLLPTEIVGASARLNGLVFTSATQPSNAWFEWGTNSALGNKTQTVSVGALPSVKHTEVITGLTQGQTYYYRVVAENPYGKAYGSIINFVSSGVSAPNDTSVVINTTPRPATVKAAVKTTSLSNSTQSSLVMLTLNGGTEMITGGEKRSYHVEWKNVSGQQLKNVILRVVFPQTMNFESATKGVFSATDNAVVIEVKTLSIGESGDAFITAVTDRGVNAGDLAVVTANMVYTGTSGIQGDAFAYVTHRVVVAANGLGASIFGAGSFLPTTLLGWMLLIILVLILVLLGNHTYGRFSDTPTPAH